MTALIDLDAIVSDAVAAVADVGDLDELQAIQTGALGKKAPIVAAKKELGSLPADQRAERGRAINEARAAIETAIAEREIGARRDERDPLASRRNVST